MRIKTQFFLHMTIFGIVLLIIAVSALLINRQIERLNRQDEIARNIEREAGELGYLSNNIFSTVRTSSVGGGRQNGRLSPIDWS